MADEVELEEVGGHRSCASRSEHTERSRRAGTTGACLRLRCGKELIQQWLAAQSELLQLVVSSSMFSAGRSAELCRQAAQEAANVETHVHVALPA